jgi:phosphoribosylglycinamide formyltransferase 1
VDPVEGAEVTRRRGRLAVLLSGRGSNFEAIADAVADGRIPNAEIVAVISDVPGAPGLAAAERRGLPAFVLDRRESSSRADHERRVREVLDRERPDLVCLAGYMRVLSPEFVSAYPGRILNIHPSLLPKFPGLHPQRRAIEAGETTSGCTVHFVDEGIDSGRVVLQRAVAIEPGDDEETLAARILREEHAAYPEAIRRVLASATDR